MGTRITSRIKEWNAKTEHQLDVAFADLSSAILRDSQILAPVAEVNGGNLKSSGRIERVRSAVYKIVFGGSGKVPYAKRRHYENKKNPQTLRYLERAGDSNARNVKRYLRGL